MTLSMLLRAVCDASVAHEFASSLPPVISYLDINIQGPIASMSVFTAEMFLTAVMVLGMLDAR